MCGYGPRDLPQYHDVCIADSKGSEGVGVVLSVVGLLLGISRCHKCRAGRSSLPTVRLQRVWPMGLGRSQSAFCPSGLRSLEQIPFNQLRNIYVAKYIIWYIIASASRKYDKARLYNETYGHERRSRGKG
jgi:hypothetical protein